MQEEGGWVCRDTRIPCSLLCYSSFQHVLSREIPFSATCAELGMHFQPGKLFLKVWEAGLGWGDSDQEKFCAEQRSQAQPCRESPNGFIPFLPSPLNPAMQNLG